MKMRKMMKRGISLLLALVMILGYLPAAVPHVHAASNLEGGLEGQEADVFSALGFDTTVEPEGYDANTTDNPYGREKLTGNQIFEMVIGSSSGMKRAGYDNNGVSVSGTVGSLSGTKMPLDVFGGAAGDFDGDGLPGEIIYVGIPNFDLSNSGCAYLPVRMYLYDGKSGSFSGNRDIATLNKIAYEEREFNYGGYEGDPVLTRVTKLYDLDLYGYTEVTAGDYDGDGYSEIAVYVPETGNARIDVYKWMRDENSTADSWKDWSNWSVIWSRPISGTDYVPNMVSLVSSDINRDGIDDLGIAYSGLQKNQNNWGVVSWSIGQNSQAAILWGSRNNALQNNTSLSLCEGELGTQFRTSLNVGDINGDGYQELVVTGQPTTDFRSNTTRSIIVYTYDGVGGMAALYKGNQKVVDGAYEMVTKYDEEGNPYEVEEWVSNNGFDANYLSQPYLRTNAAVLKLEGYDYNYLYLDSCIYEFIEGSLTLKMCLDDASYDGNNTLNATWLSSEPYMEYGAAAADLNGNSYDQLYSSFLSWVDPVDATLYSTLTPLDDPATPDVDESKENDPQFNYWEIRSGGYSGLQGNGSGALSAKTHSQKTDIKEFDPDKMANYGPQDLPHYLAIPADVDLDTTIVEYTGIHYLTYSDPEVLAVIAAAPYFEDVDIISDYDYAWQNTTSWTTTEGEGHGTLVTVDLEAGAFYSSTKVVSSFLTSLETSVNFTLEWEESSTSTTEYSLTFETSQDEDAVAFFSIPMEHYVYMVYRPDKDGNYVSEQQIISNQFQPVYQVLNLDYYESIRKDYEDQLPAIAGKVLTSTPGDPGSYPSSTAGYDVISQWNKDAAGVSFGNGAITQEITVTQEEAETYNLGCAVDFQLGFGGKAGVALGSVTEFEAQGGIQFSLNPGGGWTDMTMTGTTISGTVTNMPLEFQDYGYYYNWKIFSYAHKFGNSTIPVISYIVNDVQEPPKLPADFQQDVQRTTSDKNVLTWTYDGEYSEFILYKYFDFPEGGGLKEIASFASGETPYVLKYDEAGNPYKEYYFEDTNLAPYSEYQYAIQVERLSKTPPLSAPSALLTARTKASVGNPLMTINESDGEDNGVLLVYPDRNSYLTVNVNGPDGEADFDYYSTVQYQWQKKVQGAWEDMANETDRTLVFANSGKEVEGDYRCRVNVLTKSDNTAISVYTDPVQVTHSKRTSVIENAYVRDVKGGVELYAKVSNAHTDSGAIPSGSVVFNLTHVQSGRPYQYTGTLDGTGVYTEIITSKLPAGTYNVKISYTGSKIFKSCVGDCVYLSQIEKGYSIDSLQTMTYGDGADIIFNEITTINGHAVQTSVNAKAIVLVAGEMNTITKSGGWITSDVGVKPTVPSGCTLVQPGDPVVQGRNYMIRFLESRKAEGGSVPKDWYVTFTPEFSGVIRWTEWRSPNVLIISEKDTGYLENAGTGLYKLAENTPVGNIYTIVAQSADGVSVSRKITVEPRAITLQLPTVVKKQDSGLAMGDFTYGELPVVSGTWARCDSDAEGNLTGDLASTSVNPSYTDTAGKAFNKNSMLATCGYFTIGAVDNLDNYSVTFRAGSLSVIGGNKPITFGVRPFEGEDVGTLYMVSPDYAYTREDKGITVNQAVGSRVVFTAAPDEGYQVYDWYVDGVAQGITDNRFAHVMLNQDTTVEVQFVFKPDTLVFGTVGATEGGTLTCSDSGLTSGSIVVPNTYMTFTAQAKDGYHFKEWRYTELGKGTAYFAEDEGDMSSTFNLLMPKNSCSIYAVFARDGYTLNYTDKHGVDGLTAWYWGSTSGDTTAQLEKITVASGDTVPGDTQIVIQARDGFELDEDYNFVSVGSQGTADYQNGTYTLVLTEDTDVSAYTIQHDFDVTVAFDVSKTYAFCEGMKVTLTVDGTEHIYDYTEEMTTKSVSDIPGGSKVTVTVSYPSYYSFNGWDVNGTVRTDETYTIAGLNADTVFTLKLTEDPVYKVTLADISGKGTYSVTLPEGAGQSENVVTCHENDPLTIQVIPDSGYTVTYWNVISGDAENSWETKASSLKYQFPQLTADYTFEPIFSGSTYHIVSWPTLRYYGVTLNPEEGYLATVASGNEFKFTLSGGEDSYEYVLVNGLLFYNAANMGSHYPFRYEEVGGKRIYTISNITGDQEISLSQEKPVYGVNVTPATAEVPAGKTVTLKAESYGIETDVYTWSIQTMNGTSLDVELLQRSASDTFVYEVPKNPGEQVTITIHAGNSDNETRYDIVANHVTITVTDAVDAIAVTTDDLTVQPDGSYLIHPITPDNTVGKYDLDAKVTMVSGMTNTDVTWTLWGAQMRGTSIDKNGVLTVSPKEYGTDGQMKVIATYTYPNGDTDTKETVINLSTDAYVATEVVRDIHGGVAEIGYVAGGKTVTVTATPDENHAVAVWTINGVAVADNTANELIFTAEEMTHYSVSVEFTHYYPNIEHDETNHWYECSCGDKIEVAEHYDFDKNHHCDKCDYRMSECDDADKDHFCDWCGERTSECADEVKDHICDWCGETLSVCIDEDTDHFCDWCEERVSDCADENNNHFCDYCKTKLTECKDESRDHNCDICGRELTKCGDEDKDHLCDICDLPLSECEDEDKDHNCDVCGEPNSECTDEDKNHNCDYCGKENMTECADQDPKDHICDICGETLTACADDDDDHVCDVCGEKYSDCADEEPADHFCDICGEEVSDCADADKDHACDVCGKELSTCADEDNDHNCDVCGDGLSECADEADAETGLADHYCDVCGKHLTSCVDEDTDNICDICGKELNVHDCADENRDHKCDICGKELSECADEDSDHNCDICGKTLSVCVDAADEETGLSDHNCDICGKEMSKCADAEPADHNCDICGKDLGDCVDENPADHICDVCTKELGTCADVDPEDHNCDICGIATSKCADEEPVDHKCDICDKTLTVCKDEADAETNLADHMCDICGEPVSSCADEDRNHDCDVCGKELGTCADEDNDHNCDVCNEPVSECKDEADEETGFADHICDICGEILDACKDEADEETGFADHKCDTCGKVLTQCDDTDPEDGICDICGQDMHVCVDELTDENGFCDHLCDHCGYKISECLDEETDEEGNTDHICDICGAENSLCVDEQTDDNGHKDHMCDICGEPVSECTDSDDHLCDICGEKISDCTDADHDDVCDVCGGETYAHTDEGKDHRCDVCFLPLSECDDGDNDHLCDYCGVVWSTCVDADKNHACDICGAFAGTHAETENSHICEYCGKAAGECVDNSSDHLCDICGETVSECADADPMDHMCDICGKELSTCKDEEPKDHICDICGTELSKCADEDVNEEGFRDHKCDYCGADTSVCADENKDHACDICGVTLTTCLDEVKDHLCDICGDKLSDCADENDDHKCDHCEERLSECVDGNDDHLCDLCGEPVTETADKDRDHICDICGETISDCSDSNADHICDTCGRFLGNCADEDKDHKCDVCGDPLSECADEDKNHICDYCEETLSECADEDSDHKCDLCGEEISKCADEDKDHKCDICAETLSECTNEDEDHLCDLCGEPVTECVDEDKDHNCDICGEELSKCTDEDGDYVCDHCSASLGGIIRVFGANRFKTSFKVADELKQTLGVEKFSSVIIASGTNFADALSGSYLAAVKQAPMLLTLGDTMNAELHGYIEKNLVKGGTVYILGGENAVPGTLDVMMEGYHVVRLAGENRFDTNLMVLNAAGVKAGEEVLVCTSTNFADSLSASATGKPILLVWNEKGVLTEDQEAYLQTLNNCTFTVIGGENAVGSELADTIGAYGKVSRLSGKNRFETSVLVAQKYFEETESAVLAYAWDFPDGLCGGALAYAMKAPLILTMTDYEEQAAGYVQSGNVGRGVVLGGEKLISDGAARTIFQMEETEKILVK